MPRIQFDVSEQEATRYAGLMQATGIITKKDLFANAIALFFWVVEEVKNGRIIVSINEEGGKQKELWMPALQRARRK